MQYMGGKHRLAKQIVERIEHYRRGRRYLEPFVGGGHILERVPQGAGRMAGDANVALINLYDSVQLGWEPPDTLTKEEWLELRERMNPEDPMTAFAGIGCSFMGMWFGGYANFAARTKRTLLRQRKLFEDVIFHAGSFDAVWYPEDALVYCDPPYANTAGYPGAGGTFDHAYFWDTLRLWAERGCTVLVSEYTAPPEVPCIAEWPVKGRMKSGGAAVERLFLLEE
jgi:DNA adenine methylase